MSLKVEDYLCPIHHKDLTDAQWNSIYHKFRQWCRLGLFDRLLKIINADEKEATLLEIDSTFCKVHQASNRSVARQCNF